MIAGSALALLFLDGAYVERGCVIAAGAVVRGRIPAYSVVAGVPAKVIKSRLTMDVMTNNDALIKNNVAAEMHIFQNGGHGFGTHLLAGNNWMDLLQNWMKHNGYLSAE